MGDGWQGEEEDFRQFWVSSVGTLPDHAPVGDAAYVVERPDWGKTEPPIEVLRRELCRKRYLARSGVICSLEKKPHHQITRTLPACFGDRRHPRHLGLAAFDERKCQPARGDRPALAAACHGWWKGGKGDQAARVVGVGDAQISHPLLLGKDPAPYLERRESFVGTDRGSHLDPR
jgi:hypothetical protein